MPGATQRHDKRSRRLPPSTAWTQTVSYQGNLKRGSDECTFGTTRASLGDGWPCHTHPSWCACRRSSRAPTRRADRALPSTQVSYRSRREWNGSVNLLLASASGLRQVVTCASTAAASSTTLRSAARRYSRPPHRRSIHHANRVDVSCHTRDSALDYLPTPSSDDCHDQAGVHFTMLALSVCSHTSNACPWSTLASLQPRPPILTPSYGRPSPPSAPRFQYGSPPESNAGRNALADTSWAPDGSAPP